MPTNGLGGLAYRDFAGFSHRIAQEHIGFVPSPANLEIVWLVEEERIDVVNFGATNFEPAGPFNMWLQYTASAG